MGVSTYTVKEVLPSKEELELKINEVKIKQEK